MKINRDTRKLKEKSDWKLSVLTPSIQRYAGFPYETDTWSCLFTINPFFFVSFIDIAFLSCRCVYQSVENPGWRLVPSNSLFIGHKVDDSREESETGNYMEAYLEQSSAHPSACVVPPMLFIPDDATGSPRWWTRSSPQLSLTKRKRMDGWWKKPTIKRQKEKTKSIYLAYTAGLIVKTKWRSAALSLSALKGHSDVAILDLMIQ